MSRLLEDLPNCPTIPLHIRKDAVLGWVVHRAHHITGLPQVVAYSMDRDDAIRQARNLTNQPA